MSDDVVYGFPCVENPHDFSPDEDCCSPEEIAFWKDAKKRWDAGERNVRGNRCDPTYNDAGELFAHVTRTSWGIGTNSITICDECGDFGHEGNCEETIRQGGEFTNE